MTPDIRDIVDGIRAEIPVRVTSRETAENGNPEMAAALLSYVTDGEDGHWRTRRREEQAICDHPSLRCAPSCQQKHSHVNRGGRCPTCDDTGLRTVARLGFDRPYKKALDVLSRRPVPRGRPRLDEVVWAFAVNDGDVTATITALRTSYSFMWRERPAQRWVQHALFELRAVYREDVPARILGKSENQSIAEAA